MIRKRITVMILALASALGLTLGVTTPAQAITEPFTAGYVTHIVNGWSAAIGVWYSNPPGQGCACNLWYPINPGSDNTWTEQVGVNIAPNWACHWGYYGSRFDGWHTVYGRTDGLNGILYVGNWGRIINDCWQYA